jgi:adenine deaminase
MIVFTANIIDIINCTIHLSTISVNDGKIFSIETIHPFPDEDFPYMMPGFVDAHVHIESSMLTPAQFARMAVVHGTIATVSDPHEIGNVLGVKGVEFMIENGRKVPFKFCFGAPSCVPATVFETAGATITPQDIAYLFTNYPEVGYLAEVMNFPGVINKDPDMVAKINIAQNMGKPIDGHAPGLRGDMARRYIEAGPSTDHECFTNEEALEKLQYGMKILIREGSAAKNFDALINLLPQHYENMMFCSDDKHPDSLEEGHINQLVARAVALNYDIFKVLQVACINPVLHYRLPVGLLKVGDPADFIVVNNLKDFVVNQTYINGRLVANKGKSYIDNIPSPSLNQFNCLPKRPNDFAIYAQDSTQSQALVKVIETLDGQLITNQIESTLAIREQQLVCDVNADILKVAVVNRYKNATPAVAFIKNFGLKTGAIASSVAHDSHNIIVVGTNDVQICEAVNLIIEAQGGISAVGQDDSHVLPLPIGGILSGEDGYWVAEQYSKIDQFAKQALGCTLGSPFMSLSFMALLVIPKLKLSDLGLFDGENFCFTNVETLHATSP